MRALKCPHITVYRHVYIQRIPRGEPLVARRTHKTLLQVLNDRLVVVQQHGDLRNLRIHDLLGCTHVRVPVVFLRLTLHHLLYGEQIIRLAQLGVLAQEHGDVDVGETLERARRKGQL